MKYVIFMLLTLLISACEKRGPCTERAKVVSVGGCDKYGECGIMLDNNQRITGRYPVVGEEYCVKH